MSSKQRADLKENGSSGPTVEPNSKRTDGELSRDELFEVLGNRRRQYVLSSLKHSENGEIDFSELVTHVAAMENDVPTDQVDSDERKSVYVGLRQTHLPKMDEYDLIEYDRDRGRVTLDDAAEQAQLYLEYVPEKDIPWAHYYLGLSSILGAIVVLTWQGIYPFGNISGLAIATITLAMFAVSAVIHSLYTRRNRLDRTDRVGDSKAN